jgi:hypothetical protein
MTYREIKEKLEIRGFKQTAFQTDYELPMLHFTNPKLSCKNWEVTIYFSHDVIIPEDVQKGRQYSFDEEWVLDAEISSFHSDFDMSMSFMSEDTLDTDGSSEENIIYLYGKDLYLVDKVLDLMIDPYASINFAIEYSQKVAEFMNWIKNFIPIIDKLKLIPVPHRRNGNEDVLYSSIGMKFELDDIHGIWFNLDIVTWKMWGKIKLGLYTDKDSTFFDFSTPLKDFRTELGIQWQERLWYKEAMKSVKSISYSKDEVIYKDGKRGKREDLLNQYL